MEQTWNDLLFAHWPVPPETLRPLIPAALPLDTFNGQSWVAVTPFHMTGVRPRFVLPLPGVSAFPELNVRTYVTCGGKPGVFFFSLDAGSGLAAWAARATYRLPYFHAHMRVAERDGWFHYDAERDKSAENEDAQFRGKYRPIAPVQLRKPGNLEHWLSERYCLYSVIGNSVYRAEIHHQQWSLQDAEAEISVNTMAEAAGVQLPRIQPLTHYSKRLQVLVWPLKRA